MEQSAAAGADSGGAASAPKLTANKKVWPYNLFSEGAEAHHGRK
jgi:hypothetical protein